MSKKSQPLTAKDYAWIVGVTAAVVALVPLLAVAGAAVQIGFAMLLPAAMIANAVRVFTTEPELLVTQIQGIELPDDVRMHPRHTWARRASSKCVVAGVDDFAQRLIGPVESISAQPVGTKVREGDVIATLKHGEREIPVHAPMAGTIAYVNPALARDPAVVNRSCYGRGWLVELTPEPGTLKDSLKALIGVNRAARWMRREIDKLVALTTPPELGHTMADGGELGADVSSSLDDATWRKVTGAFFA